MPKTITPRVSDHAMLRYLERVKNLDIEKVRAEILTPFVSAAIESGAGGVRVGGHHYVVNNGCITTILPNGARPNRKRESEGRR